MKVPDGVKFILAMVGIVLGFAIFVFAMPVLDVTLTHWNCKVFSQAGPAYKANLKYWCGVP